MSDRSDFGRRYRFEAFTLDAGRGALQGPGGEIKLRPKSYKLLLYLVRNAGRLVGREELLDAVWGHAAVTDDSLTQCLVEIRRALGDTSRRVVRTVPRRGYVFEAQVTVVEPIAPVPGQPPPAAALPAGAVASPASPAMTPGETPGAQPLPPGRTWRIALLAGALLVAALGWWGLADRDAARVESPPGLAAEVLPNSIAVLPFADLSATQDQEYFGDGIAEEILNLLAQAPELKVIARTSSFSFKDQLIDITSIAARLGVAHVLEGSVRVSGNRVRVTAQLIGGRDGAHLWSQSYDRQVGELLEVQRDIAAAVSGVLQATLIDTPLPAVKRPVDPRAYDLYLRARFLFQRRNPGDLELALEQFEAALAVDPDYAPAQAGLAGALFVLSHEDERFPPESALPRRKEAAERALELDPELPEAHLRAAHVYMELGDWDTATHHFRIARKLDPDDPLLLGNLAGMALGQGDLEQAVALAGRVVTRDPLSLVARNNLAIMLAVSGRLDEARAQYHAARDLAPARAGEFDQQLAGLLILEERHEEALELLGDTPTGRVYDATMAIALQALGREQEAAAAVSRLQVDVGGETAMSLAEVYAQRGEFDTAFHWLATSQAESVREGPTGIYWWARQSHALAFLRPLHDAPRWAALHLGVHYREID
ncbi:MAG TPA: winged helix-turn-helix domain-containing protein [Burkholderiales bacterium]|nr:winged helix-turn-helix domain-containing protein [Burkholderiales bacterium]